MKPVLSTVFAGLLVACATAENDMGGNLELGGSSGSGSTGGGGSGATTGGTGSATSGSSSGGSGGSAPSGGQQSGGTGGTGFVIGGSGGSGGAATGGGGSAGGNATGGTGGSGGTGGKATGGTGGSGGKATGGSGGTGGTPNGTCAGSPIGPKTDWTAKALHEGTQCTDPTGPYCAPPARAIDGDLTNRYSTGANRTADEWLQIDFGEVVAVSRVVLTTATGNGDFTGDYEVRMSNAEADFPFAPVIVSGTGVINTTTIDFPSIKTGQFLRVYQKTANTTWWSVAEVDVTCQ